MRQLDCAISNCAISICGLKWQLIPPTGFNLSLAMRQGLRERTPNGWSKTLHMHGMLLAGADQLQGWNA